MSSLSLIRQYFSGRQDFPLRLFAAAFVISITITVFSGWQSWQLHHQYEVMSRKHVTLTESVGRIMLFDEVLTMSARMAAATGDLGYEKRYDAFDPQLTMEIDKVRAILPRSEIKRFVAETDEANLALVRMERQAFALVHQGKRQDALNLLNSPEYLRLKEVYADGMEKTVQAATALIEEDVLNRRVLSFWLAAVNAVGTLLLLATWFFAIRSARSWAAERREASAALLQAQDELVRKEKLALLGQVADTVGHELRNPLGVMNNAVYYLQAVLSDADETTREYLGIIKDEIADAERIVSDLLDAVRTKTPHPEKVEVGELMQQVLRKCDVPASVTVHLDIPETLPAIRVDPLQMRQVFWNLITNGAEAMPDGGELKIRVDEDQAANTVTIRIMDNGSGITQEHHANLFQPMFTTKARRVGLGLVVVKNLTQANGGSVGVESIPGKGSEFIVTLPSAN